MKKPKPPRINTSKITIAIATIITTISLLTLLLIKPDKITITAGLILTTLLVTLVIKNEEHILYKLAKENEYKEWRTGKKILDQQAIEKMKKILPDQMQARLGELQSENYQQKQVIQELKNKLEKPTEIKTQEAAQKEHANKIHEFKENASKYQLPDKNYKLLSSTPPHEYIGQLTNIWRKQHETIIEYKNQNGETEHTQPTPEDEALPRKFEEQVNNADTLLIHFNQNGEWQPPAYIMSEG